MSGNSLGVVLSPGALAGAERSGGERSEPQRNAAAAKASADPAASSSQFVGAARPDSEVLAKAKRSSFTAEYKLRILQEAEAAAATPGGVGALLRREGFYSSLLAYWRRARAGGILDALTPRKRGPKSKRDPMAEEMEKLRRQNARMAEDLRKAHLIIDVPQSGRAAGPSDSGARPGGKLLMAAVNGLLPEVSLRAACAARWRRSWQSGAGRWRSVATTAPN